MENIKELGFDEPCFGAWVNNELFITENEKPKIQSLSINQCTAPLYQQAFRWFRKQYKLIFFVFPQIEDGGCEYQIVHYNPHKIMYKVYSKGMTYEEAELACLKKLIEIVEPKSE
jgi:hypothetical protein